MQSEERVFLLGGGDLEMNTIKSLLIEKKEIFYDYGLRWDNANLSQYKDLINDFETIYGIELNEDIKPPIHYVRIDHHNDFVNKKSSLAQVADILGVNLNRFQTLVCANDSSYIPGLKSVNASESEIYNIRMLDRKYQGVLESEEKDAELLVRDIDKSCNILKVKTFLNHFSTIVDRLFPFDNLVVYSPVELTFYGKDVFMVKDLLENDIKQGKAYFGGDPLGFCGLKRGFFTSVEIEEYVNRIIELF